MITSYHDGDKHCMAAMSNDAFFSPDLSCMILKDKKNGEERFVPLTNVQDFSLIEAVIKKNEPEIAQNISETPTEAPVKKTPGSKKTKAET